MKRDFLIQRWFTPIIGKAMSICLDNLDKPGTVWYASKYLGVMDFYSKTKAYEFNAWEMEDRLKEKELKPKKIKTNCSEFNGF